MVPHLTQTWVRTRTLNTRASHGTIHFCSTLKHRAVVLDNHGHEIDAEEFEMGKSYHRLSLPLSLCSQKPHVSVLEDPVLMYLSQRMDGATGISKEEVAENIFELIRNRFRGEVITTGFSIFVTLDFYEYHAVRDLKNLQPHWPRAQIVIQLRKNKSLLSAKDSGLGDCPICYEDLRGGSSVTTCCSKRVHIDCIFSWLEISNTCPFCRQS